MEYGRKANLSTKSCSISQNEKITREIAQNGKSSWKRKKLLKIREVAKNLPSNLWKALGIEWSKRNRNNERNMRN